MSQPAIKPDADIKVEDEHLRPSTSTSGIEFAPRVSSKQSSKDKKSNYKKWSAITNIFKKSTSPKSEKKLKSKSLSVSSLSSSKDIKSISSKDSKFTPDNDIVEIPNKIIVETPDKDNKTTPNKDDKATQDKDDKTINESKPEKDNEKTPDEDIEPKKDKDNDSTSSNDTKALKGDDTSSETGEGTTPLIEEDSTSEIDECPITLPISVTSNDAMSEINNDTKSPPDGDTESITGKDVPNNNELTSGHESCVTPLADLSFDGSTNNPRAEHDESIEDAHVTLAGSGGGLAAIEDRPEDPAATGGAHEYEKILEHRVIVLRELVQTEKTYVQDLSLVVDGLLVAMRDPEAVACAVPIPEDLARSETDKLIFNNVTNIYEWHGE